MRIGVTFPQTEISDAGAVRAYGQGVEELGFTHVRAYEHVLGADPAAYPGWSGFFDIHDGFHEPMVLFSHLAAITSLELATGILILPQRQTALVAKQAATLDVLCNGRLRLGVALGWNRVEYEALGQDFATRATRMEEQVQLMRLLWTKRSVTFHGAFDHVTAAGLAPLPVQRPIPVWFGADSARAFRRAGRLGDGWIPMMSPGPELERAREWVAEGAREAGRDPASLGLEGEAGWEGSQEALAGELRQWREAGATHVSINMMGCGLASVDDHLAALALAAETVTAVLG